MPAVRHAWGRSYAFVIVVFTTALPAGRAWSALLPINAVRLTHRLVQRPYLDANLKDLRKGRLADQISRNAVVNQGEGHVVADFISVARVEPDARFRSRVKRIPGGSRFDSAGAQSNVCDCP
jgi:hypothetical protein